MLHINRIRKSKRKSQYGGQLYDILPEYKEGFVDYKGIDPNVLLNATIQLQNQYDIILKEKKDALKSIRDAQLHSVYNPLKAEMASSIIDKNKSLLEESNGDLLNPLYSQGIMNTIDEKLGSKEWTAAVGNSPQIEQYETERNQRVASGNVQDYDDMNLQRYNKMVQGQELYNPFVVRPVFQTPNYDAAFDKIASDLPEEELVAYAPIRSIDENGHAAYEAFDVQRIESKIKSQPGLYAKFKTLADRYYTTQEGSSFARKVSKELGIPVSADGTPDMSNPALKKAFDEQVLHMMYQASIRNQSYKEKGSIEQLQGRLTYAQHSENLQAQMSQAQANLDARAAELAQKQAEAASKGSGTSSGSNSGSGSSTGNGQEEKSKSSFGLLGEANLDNTTAIDYSIKENNEVNYSSYKVAVVKAEETYNTKVAKYSKDLAGNITIQNNTAGETVPVDYSNNNNGSKPNMFGNLVGYYDTYNTLDGLDIKFDGGNNPQKLSQLENSVKDLLTEKKLQQSSKETLASVNRQAFDKLKQETDGKGNNTYISITGTKDALYSKKDNTIIKLDSKTGEILTINVPEFIKERGGQPYTPTQIVNEVNLSEESEVMKPIAAVKKVGDMANDSYITKARTKFLQNKGFMTSNSSIATAMGVPIDTSIYTEKYNNMTDVDKAKVERAFILSDEYREANKLAIQAFEDTYHSENTSTIDAMRKLNEVAKLSATYTVTNGKMIAIPNFLTTSETTDNKGYFDQMRQIAKTMTEKPNDLSLSVYELNTEDKNNGITPTYYAQLLKNSQDFIKYISNKKGWADFLGWIGGTGGAGELQSSTVLLDGIVRDDKLGACFSGNIAYDVTDVMAKGSDKGQEKIDQVNALVGASDGRLELHKGEDNKTYIIDTQRFLVQNEIANKAMFDKELSVGDESNAVANQYNLLVESFSKSELSILRLDTYSSTNDIHVEKHIDDKDYSISYRVFWKDITGESNFDSYDNLVDVAKKVYEYNANLKQLDNVIKQEAKLINNNSSTSTNAIQNQLLLTSYRNLISPTQQQLFSKNKTKTEYTDYMKGRSSALYYEPVHGGRTSGISIGIDRGADANSANRLLLRAIREISNVASNSNGVVTYINKDIDINDITSNIDSSKFSPVQKDLLKKYFGGEVIVIYENSKLTITRNK